jgi:hypothetical protein
MTDNSSQDYIIDPFKDMLDAPFIGNVPPVSLGGHSPVRRPLFNSDSVTGAKAWFAAVAQLDRKEMGEMIRKNPDLVNACDVTGRTALDHLRAAQQAAADKLRDNDRLHALFMAVTMLENEGGRTTTPSPVAARTTPRQPARARTS